MYRIKNTTDDRRKDLLHRTATKFEREPNLGGVRIRLGTHLDITDEHYARVKPFIDEWVKKGMVDVIQLDGEAPASEKLGPTLEEWVAKGYPAENYACVAVGEPHPWGFQVRPSEGLTKYLEENGKPEKKFEGVPSSSVVVEEVSAPISMEPPTPSRTETVPLPESYQAPVVPEPSVIVEPEPAPPPVTLPPVQAPVVQAPQVPNKPDQSKNNKKFR